MTDFKPLGEYDRRAIIDALAAGTLEMPLGHFTARIKAQVNTLVDFLYDTYRDVPVKTELSDVTDISIHLRAPSILRKYIRTQVIPDPGFQVPAVPLPTSMAALAFEMGVNLVVALKCCRFVSCHAGVVANEKGAIFMCANSGGGKSTLVSVLMEDGYRLLSDEFGLLCMESASLAAYPRPVSLKNVSIDIVRQLSGKEWISPELSGTPKGKIAYRRARPDDINKAHLSAPAKLILFPSFNPIGGHYARRLSVSEAVMRLIPSSTNYHLLGEKAYLALTKMVAGAEVYEIAYRSTDESLTIVRDLAVKVGL